MTKIGIIGAGSWAMALAKVLAEQSKVLLWSRNNNVVDEVNLENTNKLYSPNFIFSKNIAATNNLSDLEDCQIILVAVPVKNFYEVLKELPASFNSADKIFVSCSKGIEKASLEFPSQIIAEILPNVKIAAISGPNFAREVLEQKPTITSVASDDINVATKISRLLATNYLRCYPNNALLSTEICGAIKNVFAIAAGALKAKNLGDNAFAALITRGLSELQMLLKAMDGDEKIVNHPCGIGDIVLTTSSSQSRNFTYGFNLATNLPIDEKVLVEGKFTTFALVDLAKKLNIELPITMAVYNSINNPANIDIEIKKLMERPQRF
jgi:glycerol-3-phosphate dehydrogenase (NAD(P)+)